MHRRHNIIIVVVVVIVVDTAFIIIIIITDGDGSRSQLHHSSRASRDLWEPAGRVTYKTVRQIWELTLYTRMSTDFPGHRQNPLYCPLLDKHIHSVYVRVSMCENILNV